MHVVKTKLQRVSGSQVHIANGYNLSLRNKFPLLQTCRRANGMLVLVGPYLIPPKCFKGKYTVADQKNDPVTVGPLLSRHEHATFFNVTRIVRLW